MRQVGIGINRAHMVIMAAALALVLSFTSRTGSAAAASTQIMVEPSTANISQEVATPIKFYVQTDLQIFSVKFRIKLTNLRIINFDASDSDFNGFVGPATGGMAGSTDASIAAVNSGKQTGTGKLYVGQLNVQAINTGTSEIVMSELEGYDGNLNTQSVTGQNGSYTVIASQGGSRGAGAAASDNVLVPSGYTPSLAPNNGGRLMTRDAVMAIGANSGRSVTVKKTFTRQDNADRAAQIVWIVLVGLGLIGIAWQYTDKSVRKRRAKK